MADYCTTANIQNYLGNITLSANSSPTLTQVGAMISDASENIIDPVLRRYLSLPVSDTQGLAYLKQWCIWCVLGSIYRAIEAESELASDYEARCTSMKEDFMEDPGLVVTPLPDDPDNEALASGSTRPTVKWKKDEVQW